MDIGIGVVVGTLARWVYDLVKRYFHLQDGAAAWGALLFTLIIAAIYDAIAGKFAGLSFDWSHPAQAIGALTSAWAVIWGTASAWYPFTKKREK